MDSLRKSIPGGDGPWSTVTPAIGTASQRFTGIWIDAICGLLFAVATPISIHAITETFLAGTGSAEQTSLAAAIAYGVLWYCGRRLGAFSGSASQSSLSYVAPVAVFTYSAIAVVLLLLEVDFSSIQFFCSGGLAIIWLAFVTRVRLPSALANAAMAGAPVLDRRYVVESLTGRMPLSGLMPEEVGALLSSQQYLAFRRGIELVLTVLVLPLLLPVLTIIALLIRLDGPGSVIFMQDRVGRHGRIFRIYKFRTMFHGADGPSITVAGDPRVTRIGGFLRRYRLDELPQVVNVLLGDMSWVGPRPEALALDRLYERANPHFALRRIVLPGVTGWGQIHEASKLEYNLKLEYDLYYLKHCSPWLDLMIVLRTFAVIVGGTGIR